MASLMRPMPKSTGSNVAPKRMQALYAAITGLTDAFCAEHLNEDYRRLAQGMTAALCRKRQSPLTSGGPHLGVRDCLCSRANKLPDRSFHTTLHDHSQPVFPV